MVSGQDPRYLDPKQPLYYQNREYKERNPKFLCNVHQLATVSSKSAAPPCVVYSFGSWDDISFEVRTMSLMDKNNGFHNIMLCVCVCVCVHLSFFRPSRDVRDNTETLMTSC